MAVSFSWLLASASVCVARRSYVASQVGQNYFSNRTLLSSLALNMPAKRKAAGTKAVKETDVEEAVIDNNAAGDVPKPRKGRQAKEAAVEPKEKKGRAAKNQVKEEENEESAPGPSKGRKGKAAATKTTEDVEPRPKRGRVAKEKPEETKSKKAENDEATLPKIETTTKTLLNDTVTDYSKIDFTCSRKNANGKSFNVKISSWNVDGLRAWYKKNGHYYIEKEDPDILCLQETKCTEDKLPSEIKSMKLYKSYWCSSQKDGYAGVGLLTKKEPISVQYGIGNEEHDEDGRCITAEYAQFYLVNVYVPNAGRKLVTLPKRLEWNSAFKSFVENLDAKKPVVVCGDMNVAHSEIDLANPKTNKKNAGFTQEERDGMTDFLAGGYVDVYRKFYPEKTAVYTFWSYMTKARPKNVGWRLDYFLTSSRFVENVCDHVVRSEVLGSDHCPIALFLHV